jgi:cytochrome P450 family 138
LSTVSTAPSTQSPVQVPRLRLPRPLQVASLLVNRRAAVLAFHRRYGPTFSMVAPLIGRVVVTSDPADVRTLFRAGPDVVDIVDDNLPRVLGPGALMGQRGEVHRKRRRLLTPPFHGRRLPVYEQIVEEETLAELARCPKGAEFPIHPVTTRITMSTILRAVFGAEGAELDELRTLIPKMVRVGSVLAIAPIPEWNLGGYAPWGRYRILRKNYDDIIDRLAARAEEDLDSRQDILSMLLQSRFEDGSPMTRSEIRDQLLGLLAAGHETTATVLAWAFERIRRHPELLDRLVAEVDGDGHELIDATLTEVQRARPATDMIGRKITADSLELSSCTLTRDEIVVTSVHAVHNDADLFANPERFDPDRFLGTRGDPAGWIPFGGGARRCIGAAFAQMEMRVVLRTVLRHYTLEPTEAPAERFRFRGIVTVPADGGKVILRPRS